MNWGGNRMNSGRKKIKGKEIKIIIDENILDDIKNKFEGNTKNEKIRNCLNYGLKSKSNSQVNNIDYIISSQYDDIKNNPHQYLEHQILNLQKRFNLRESSEFNSLVNFSTNKQEDIHNWFYYKEGYSSKLVDKLLEKFMAKEGEVLLDPFVGSGTTLVEGKNRTLKTIGFDVNPIAVFVSNTKTRNYKYGDLNKLRELELTINTNLLDKIDLVYEKPKLDIIDKIFSSKNLDDLLKLKSYIEKFKDNEENVYNILKLAYLQSIENVSNMKKDGNGIKYKKNASIIEVVSEFKKNLKIIISSLEQASQQFFKGYESLVIPDSFLNAKNYLSNNVDYVICSPPYANCFDYCAVYKMELWMGEFVKEYNDFKKLRNLAIRSHVNGSLRRELDYEYDLINWISEELEGKKLWDKKIPYMIKAYFDDMTKVIKNIGDVMKKNGKCAIVVGNSSYKGYVIPTDIMLAHIAEKLGFEVIEIDVARFLRTSSQQMKNFSYIRNYLRESVIILNKRS